MSQSTAYAPPLFAIQTATPPPIPEHEQPLNRMMEGAGEYLTDSEMLSLVLSRKSPVVMIDRPCAGRELFHEPYAVQEKIPPLVAGEKPEAVLLHYTVPLPPCHMSNSHICDRRHMTKWEADGVRRTYPTYVARRQPAPQSFPEAKALRK